MLMGEVEGEITYARSGQKSKGKSRKGYPVLNHQFGQTKVCLMCTSIIYLCPNMQSQES